jgi:hypothetical protein
MSTNTSEYFIASIFMFEYFSVSWQFPPDEVNDFFFLVYLILPAALVPGVHSASNRNEYQKQKNNVSGEYSTAGE